MPQSLTKNYVHITFSTRKRQPLIDEGISHELYSYIGGICSNLESFPVEVGGHTDHIHILCLLSKNIHLAKLVEEIKTHSSKWIKSKGAQYEQFYWQIGYGAFSVGTDKVVTIQQYIRNQKQHHQVKSFQEEYRELLKEFCVEYDERYVWD
jgi:REP element-mobilizing transposase RayT